MQLHSIKQRSGGQGTLTELRMKAGLQSAMKHRQDHIEGRLTLSAGQWALKAEVVSQNDRRGRMEVRSQQWLLPFNRRWRHILQIYGKTREWPDIPELISVLWRRLGSPRQQSRDLAGIIGFSSARTFLTGQSLFSSYGLWMIKLPCDHVMITCSWLDVW